MKRSIILLFTLLIIFSVAVSAQDPRVPTRRNQQPVPRQSMTVQRMGRMNTMQDRGMVTGIMNQRGMRNGSRMSSGGDMRVTDDLLPFMSSRLELDDSQVEELKQIRVDLVKTTGNLETDLRVARLELQDLLDTDDPNMNAIEKSINTVHELEAKLEIARLQARFDAQDVLTQEQRDQLQAPRGRGMRREVPDAE